MNQPLLEFEYERALEMITLGSQEQYSRLQAMLTVHGFILTAFGVLLTKNIHNLRTLPTIAILVFGIFLCERWLEFVEHGSETQKHFREKAIEIEKSMEGSSKLLTTTKFESPRFHEISKNLIKAFQVLYIVLMISLLLLWCRELDIKFFISVIH